MNRKKILFVIHDVGDDNDNDKKMNDKMMSVQKCYLPKAKELTQQELIEKFYNTKENAHFRLFYGEECKHVVSVYHDEKVKDKWGFGRENQKLALQKLKKQWQTIANKNQNSEFKKIKTLDKGLKEVYQGKIMDGYGMNLQCDCGNKSSIVAVRKTVIAAPKVLMMHLERGEFALDGKQVKYDHELSYPMKLEFARQTYDLIGICVHSGSTNRFGHYYAFVKNLHDRHWYEANDRYVQPCNKEDVSQVSGAIVLIYQQR